MGAVCVGSHLHVWECTEGWESEQSLPECVDQDDEDGDEDVEMLTSLHAGADHTVWNDSSSCIDHLPPADGEDKDEDKDVPSGASMM